ncbi:MAG: murein biosynthesis integral membrane protein MurJ [Pseudomonadota bacterium]
MISHTKEENQELGRAAGVVGKATLVSRILGYIRDAVIAAAFGASAGADAFFVAFRVPNLLRRLFAEGSLSVAFVPVLTGVLRRQGKAEAMVLARSALVFFSAILALVAVAGIIAAPLIVRIIAPGFIDTPWQFELTVTLTRLVFPYVLLIGLVAICMGVLNVFGHFAAPALAPVMLNIGIIGSVWVLAPVLHTPETALAIGVIVGGIMQVALQIPFLRRIGLTLRGEWTFRHPALTEISRKMLPMAFGAAAYQINVVVSTLLATLLPGGSVSYLYYADRLVQFPLGVIAIAAATAALPSFSRLAADGDTTGLRDALSFTLTLVFFITLPAMVGLVVVRAPLVSMLFERGAFDPVATVRTADALLYYTLGLWAFAGTRLVVNAFYALGRIWTPVLISVSAVAANIVFSLLLMPRMGHAGLALATSLSSGVNLLFLVIVLRRQTGRLNGRRIALSFLKALGMALVMGAVVTAVLRAVLPMANGSALGLLVVVLGSVATGAGVYFLMAKALKCPELAALVKAIR